MSTDFLNVSSHNPNDCHAFMSVLRLQTDIKIQLNTSVVKMSNPIAAIIAMD